MITCLGLYSMLNCNYSKFNALSLVPKTMHPILGQCDLWVDLDPMAQKTVISPTIHLPFYISKHTFI